MLDTNICIYVMKNYPQRLLARFNQEANLLCISVITLVELHYGAENSTRRADNLEAIAQFTSRLETLPFSSRAAIHCGQIRAGLKRIGQPVGAYDILIGAHARAEDLILVTNNTSEFRRLPGLVVEDWTAETHQA